MTGKTASILIMLAVAILLMPRAFADTPLPAPQGKVILSISGEISERNNGDLADFDLDMLQSLGVRALATTTSWTDGTQNFTGVPMRILMKAVGATGKTVEAVALNGYTYEIDMEDFALYPVLLAIKLNGRVLKVRDKGPLWIVYPLDDFGEAEKPMIERRMVWQVRQLIVK